MKKITILFLAFKSVFIFSQSWEPISEMDNNLFPSLIIATSSVNEVSIPNQSGYVNNYIGDKMSPLGIKVYNLPANSNFKVVIEGNSIMDQSTLSGQNPTEGNYFLYPKINYKYENLRNITQQTPINISYKLYIEGALIGEKTVTSSIRSLEECPYSYVDQNNQIQDSSWMFAAYVNEDSPLINNILQNALKTETVNAFKGYLGTPQDVNNQVFAIWMALQKEGIKYSNITNTSLFSPKVYSQRVRLLDQSFNFTQANCVDGSVLFASILKSIGIDPVLVLEPGHMYLGYYLDRNHSKIEFLETTMIGTINLNNLSVNDLSAITFQKLMQARKDLENINAFQVGRTYAEKSDQIEKQKNYINILGKQAVKEASSKSFRNATLSANNKFNTNRSLYSSNQNNQYKLIDIQQSRKVIKPVWR